MITVYDITESEKWDEIVCSFDKHDVYWLSGYVKAFAIHGDGEPLLFYYDDGTTRGINVVMKRDIADDKSFIGRIEKEKYFDIITPYGYGGWIIEGDDKVALFDSYNKHLNQMGVVSEFVRFHPMIANHAMCTEFYDITQLGEVVHMELSTEKNIWANFTSQNRNKIRKALKNEVQIYSGRFPDIYRQFREIYNGTMDRDEADGYYYFGTEFYTSILEDLPRNAQVFWAQKDEKIISASIIIGANGYLNYHLSGSLREYAHMAPTNLLLYEVALWGCTNGYKSLYLGGGVGSSKDDLFAFKKSFYRGELNRFAIGKKIYDKKKYEELVAMREGIKSNFFPLYRAKVGGGGLRNSYPCGTFEYRRVA